MKMKNKLFKTIQPIHYMWYFQDEDRQRDLDFRPDLGGLNQE